MLRGTLVPLGSEVLTLMTNGAELLNSQSSQKVRIQVLVQALTSSWGTGTQDVLSEVPEEAERSLGAQVYVRL